MGEGVQVSVTNGVRTAQRGRIGTVTVIVNGSRDTSAQSAAGAGKERG